MSKKITLFQFLKGTGIFPDNNFIIKLIHEGKIKIDGKIITDLMYQFRPSSKKVYLEDELLQHHKKEFKYYIFNKPSGVSCQKGEKGKTSVFDFIKNLPLEGSIKNTLFPVGRLDIYSGGLMIITNDGQLSKRLLDPKHKIPKKYMATMDKDISSEGIKKLENGVIIQLKDNEESMSYKTKPAVVKKINDKRIEITITEGKKRQIRKMLKATGYKVTKLVRVSVGNIHLGDIKEGEWREIQKPN